MSIRLLITLGPSSLSKEVITQCDHFGVFVFRINLSHTPLDKVKETIDTIRRYTKTPICLDSEGAQIRNQIMQNGESYSLHSTGPGIAILKMKKTWNL